MILTLKQKKTHLTYKNYYNNEKQDAMTQNKTTKHDAITMSCHEMSIFIRRRAFSCSCLTCFLLYISFHLIIFTKQNKVFFLLFKSNFNQKISCIYKSTNVRHQYRTMCGLSLKITMHDVCFVLS